MARGVGINISHNADKDLACGIQNTNGMNLALLL